jgi:RNA polymerase sigma-70 factor (ECF subfamily)
LEPSDGELIQCCLSGDREAFAGILTRYQKLIYNVIYNLMGNTPEAGDLFQEVFIRIYKSLGSYNPEFKFATWSAKIATNLCLDRIRTKRPAPIPVEEIEISDTGANPEEQFLAKERTRQIRTAVNQLPEKYRIPVILFHQQGLSYEEMALILNQPITIIKNRLYRARLMLREMLSSNGEEAISL